ncbi:MAG: HAMP domain-containing sensor histidine kinase [Candidatus Nealsonbacteria bacterium]|nr:HAMP domain-containing sensor histidine kinase [Candidatus Nealsonbacteria bacterium]
MKNKIIEQLNLKTQCKKYGLPLWQCPHFIFVVMGVVIMVTSLLAYFIGFRYVEDPLLICLVVMLITGFLFILSFVVVKSFENLAEASRMKLEFLAIISHQMRTPFSNLRWVIDLLNSGRVGEVQNDQQEYLKILKENSERMESLISQLLTASKFEQGKIPLKMAGFSLKTLTEKVITELKPLSNASNIEVKFECKEEIPDIFGDQDWIREVISNLLDNAIKYTKNKGEVKITIFKKGQKIYFEVKDTGAGIPKEDQKYIFEKFFRAQNILKKQTQGSGLGLFIAKSIIESHKGKIGFKSEAGEGSTFWFLLPIK